MSSAFEYQMDLSGTTISKYSENKQQPRLYSMKTYK